MFRRNVLLRKEWWEFDPTPEHRSLVLMLYRATLKELLTFKSMRRRSLTAHCRFTYRNRAKVTEKLLIDECIEEARRAVYVLTKHNNYQKTGEYEYDSMFLPKDTGQDVGKFMDEVYDPSVGKQQYSKVSDVVPGREDLHQAENRERVKKHRDLFRQTIKDEDKLFRPPAPPV
jgi:hypothetical protein